MSSWHRAPLWRRGKLTLILLGFLWSSHAIAYMAHEYAHSFLAWAFHAKSNPLALDYGHLTMNNALYLDDIDENVDYDPLFASGRGSLAALIAVAGVLFGNGVLYLLSRRLYRTAKENGKPMMAFFLFLLVMMNAGNFLSYVPNRTFSTHADMATVERGLNVSPWAIVVLLGVPFALAVWHFFAKILPGARRFLFPAELPAQTGLVLLCAYAVFEFFGSSGFDRYGPASHWIAAVSVYLLFPLSVVLCWPEPLPRE